MMVTITLYVRQLGIYKPGARTALYEQVAKEFEWFLDYGTADVVPPPPHQYFSLKDVVARQHLRPNPEITWRVKWNAKDTPTGYDTKFEDPSHISWDIMSHIQKQYTAFKKVVQYLPPLPPISKITHNRPFPETALPMTDAQANQMEAALQLVLLHCVAAQDATTKTINAVRFRSPRLHTRFVEVQVIVNTQQHDLTLDEQQQFQEALILAQTLATASVLLHVRISLEEQQRLEKEASEAGIAFEVYVHQKLTI